MNLLLAVQTYPGANQAIERHFPYYEKSGADNIIGILTEDGKCTWPNTMIAKIGRDSYIDGPVLPRRLLDTMRLMLLLPYERFCIIEWDCLFFAPLPEFTGMAAFLAGGKHGSMRAEHFYHCPWCFDFETGTAFVKKGDELLKEVNGLECSPDVFFGWVCEQAGITVTQPWDGFTKNSLENPIELEAARDHYRRGITCLHGCKTEAQLNHILS